MSDMAGTSHNWVMMGGQRCARLWTLGSEPLCWTRRLCECNLRPAGLCSECPSHLEMLPKEMGTPCALSSQTPIGTCSRGI